MGLVDDLNSVRDELTKAQSEIVTKISGLEAALAAAGTPDPAVADAVEALKAAAQNLDDVVPDVVVEEPPVE